jgi:hypothetical protein
MRLLVFILLAALLAGGCATKPAKPAEAGKPVAAGASKGLEPLGTQELLKWSLENQALIEWNVAVLAAGFNEVANTTTSLSARREALRVKAAYATASYAIASGPNPLLQVLDMLAMSELSYQTWVEDKRAVSTFGAQAGPVETAFTEIRERTHTQALKHLSADQIQDVDDMVRAWRKSHPGPAAVEFIRFEALADERSRSVKFNTDFGGLLGRIEGQAWDVRFLGERMLMLASRMPLIAEWHAEAAEANIMAQPEIAEALTAMKQIQETQRPIPQELKSLNGHMSALPTNFLAALGQQEEFKEALENMKQTGPRIQKLDESISALNQSVTLLGNEMSQIASNTQPDTLRRLTENAKKVAGIEVRSLILLATVCVAGLLLLHALLRRWNRGSSGS